MNCYVSMVVNDSRNTRLHSVCVQLSVESVYQLLCVVKSLIGISYMVSNKDF